MTEANSSRKEEPPLCVYCGQRPGVTRDHVIARCFFPGTLPSDMITVPCCEDCNKSYEKDEEYMRSLICMDYGVVESSDSALRQLVGPVTRSLFRAEHTGLLDLILDTSKPVELFTEGDIYLGQTRRIRVDDSRFCNVARKIILGLHFHRTGHRLADGYTVKVSNIGTDLDLARKILGSRSVPWNPPVSIGKDVFRYTWSSVDTDPGLGAWAFDFYGRYVFIGLTMSLGIQAEADRRLERKGVRMDETR